MYRIRYSMLLVLFATGIAPAQYERTHQGKTLARELP